MDSASSSLPFATRDVSGATGEDDGALSVAAGLAKEAALLFQAGKFVDCLRILNQLLQKKEGDPKVHHNIAIAETYQDGCSDPKRLIEALENIKKQSEELALASGEQLEVTSNDGRKSTAGTKGSNTATRSSSSAVYSDEFDTSVAIFNIAVIWFYLHEYTKSFSYLDTLYQKIEPIDEGTALRICLLLLDVALLSQHASRSADVISYTEKVFCVTSLNNQVENGPSAQQQPLLVSKSTSGSSNTTIPDSLQSENIVNANTLENSLTRTLSEEALEDEPLQLLSSLDIRGPNLQKPSGIGSSSDLPRSPAEESLSVIDLRLKLHLYKVRFLLLTRNLKAAKREVKMAMNLARGKDCPMGLYLKSQLEYARRNHRKAIKLLMASSSLADTGISTMYYNNLGCIYYQLGKHHTSGVFFSKALKNSSLVRKEKSPKLLTLSQDKSLLISYNCAMHSLACGRPFHAARCFQKASLIFFNRPLLWLRIAECCLMALEKGLIKSHSFASDRFDVNVSVFGKGKWRQLALRNGVSPNGQWEYVGKDDLFPGDGKQLDLSMSLARKCLYNALYLLDSSEAKHSPPSTEESDSREANNKSVGGGDHKESSASSGSSHVNSNGEMKEIKVGNNQSTSLQNFITEYEHIHTKENQMMKQALLADLAYVELALGDPLKALSTAKSLLKLPDCSRIYVFFGTMYVAEALCLLNQPKEAAEHLMTYISGGNNVELPYTREDCEKWTVEKPVDNEDSNGGTIASKADEPQVSIFSSPEEARGIFCANYAANFALLEDLEQADHFVKKALSDIPNSPQAILTAIYLDLKRGKTQEALTKLKQHSAVRFLPTNFTLNGSS
ncbi:TPR repeat-containing protein [Handroanthus impetiginosus]|uniref:TPR repeat-containing protein n=1 Tax=Handroanthus impetiginosus TaxID=429701 RepID=A0A2G9G7E4_9LAMI|nr:TPR repeat-containing protein [Handroanthus impetiginosus]